MFFNVNLCFAPAYTPQTFVNTPPQFQIPRNNPACIWYLNAKDRLIKDVVIYFSWDLDRRLSVVRCTLENSLENSGLLNYFNPCLQCIFTPPWGGKYPPNCEMTTPPPAPPTHCNFLCFRCFLM